MSYQTIRIHRESAELLRKIKALLSVLEGKDETMVEILDRLIEAEHKRLLDDLKK